MTYIGYARVSTSDQDSALQNDALRKAGCEKLFEDKASGAATDRPGLDEAIRYLRDGDTLIVWKLDRLGRSMRHLIEIITELDAKGVAFRSITENIDTSSSGGRLVFHLFGALAQFERDLIRERTNAGLAAAAVRGSIGGRRPVVTADKLKRARSLIASGKNVREAAARIKVGKTALYLALKTEAVLDSARPITTHPKKASRTAKAPIHDLPAARQMLDSGQLNIQEIADLNGVSVPTMRRRLKNSGRSDF